MWIYACLLFFSLVSLSCACYERSLDFEPTAAYALRYIAEVHAAYVGEVEVRRIFDTYKSRFGYGEGETLELVSAKSAKAA